MELVYIILPLALVIAGFALVAFIWAVRSGQFDDVETPARRVLLDEVAVKEKTDSSAEQERGES